ncbi:MAG: acetyl-CoA carboxylase biotin carboxylase subunit [Acidobacteriota bacterium]
MIRRLLIANRGEIALRIIRACRELGIECIAVYSDVDRLAPHVVEADRSVAIGGKAAAESYLNGAAILKAARDAGADAVHPGYGFLSERAPFARACADAELIFVGPGADSIAQMGSKIAARTLMQQAGVSAVPGMTPTDQSDAAIAAAVAEVGYPAFIKPSAGGGGIGMKIVRQPSDVADEVARARREAQAAFGDATLYVERLVERPRHVEIQIFADTHGNVVHLFERECSIQRRHQKSIEESPCPALTASVRERMGAAAVAAARAVNYVNAGTVEFLLEGTGENAQFYFLEMNTRLQVEHPVTEMVTGTDLVRAQLLVASGKPLPWSADDLRQRGHAIECRVYAEDPRQDFLPQAGPLLMYREPQGPGVRVDTGVREGTEISVHYDPLLAKLIVHAESRSAAIARAVAALQRYVVLGIRTNIEFLLAVLQHPHYMKGDIDTGFLERHAGDLQPPHDTELPIAGLAAASVHHQTTPSLRQGSSAPPVGRDPFETLRGWGLT